LDGVRRDGQSLSLAFRSIGEIPEELAAREGPHVTDLNLTECDLRSLAGLARFPFVTTLVLDKNGLTDLVDCPSLPGLVTLWFNNNAVTDLARFVDQVAELFPSLTCLSMMRNPACPGLMDIQRPDLEACRLYRRYVLWRLPRLHSVDGADVTPEERVDASLRGRFAEMQRPRETCGGGGTMGKGSGKRRVGLFERAPSAVYDPAGVRPAGAASLYKSPRPSVAVLTMATRRYDGRHSEGNRFIVDDHL
ncbi:unnamed protein product, partial [Phaeothamnion confervicola]